MPKKSRSLCVGLLALGAAAYTACAPKDAPQAAAAIPAAVTPAAEPPPPPPTPPPAAQPPPPSRPPQDRSRGKSAERTVASGTRIAAAIERGINSRTDRTGGVVHAGVNGNISDDNGRVVIPAGSTVSLTIDRLEGGSREHPDGLMELSANSVTINGDQVPLHARLAPVPFHLEGRGGRNDDRGRSGRGTNGSDGDVVVAPGTVIELTLSQSLRISSR